MQQKVLLNNVFSVHVHGVRKLHQSQHKHVQILMLLFPLKF